MLALNGYAVKRLKSTWALIPPTKMDVCKHLREVTSVANKSASLRQIMTTTPPPFIPSFPTYLTDLVYAEENKTLLPHESDSSITFINFTKHRRIYEIVMEIKKSGNIAHSIVPLKEIWPSLLHLECLTMAQLEDRSREIE